MGTRIYRGPIKRGIGIVPILAEPVNNEIGALQKQLAQEKLHVKLLTAMIEIAETELNIPIRKKYGTKQSKR